MQSNADLTNEWKRWLIYPAISIVFCVLFYTLVLMPDAPLANEASARTKSMLAKVSVFLIACTSIMLIAIVRIRRSHAKLAAKLASETAGGQLSPMERYAELTIRRDRAQQWLAKFRRPWLRIYWLPLTILLASVATLATCFILTYEQGCIRGAAMNTAVRISIKGIIVSILYLAAIVYRRYCDTGIFPVKKIELRQILADMDELKKTMPE